MAEQPLTRRDLLRGIFAGGAVGVAGCQANNLSSSTPAGVSPKNPHSSKIVFAMFATGHGSNPGSMPQAVGSAVRGINERASLDNPLDYPTQNGKPLMVINARDELDLGNFYGRDNEPVPAEKFLSTVTKTIVGSDTYACWGELAGGLPSGTHLVIGHNMVPGRSDFGQTYGRKQPRVTVQVDSAPYHAVLVGPIGGIMIPNPR